MKTKIKIIHQLGGRTYRHFMQDGLRRSSLFLMISQIINAGVGIIFWMICARFFTPHDVGLATAFISLAGLASSFTTLGLSNTIMRFIPTSKNQGGLFSAALLLIIPVSIIISLIFLTIAATVSSSLSFIQSSAILPLLFIVITALINLDDLFDSTVIALKKSQFILLKAVSVGVTRLILPLLLAATGTIGIVVSHGGALAIGVGVSMFVVAVLLLTSASFKPDYTQLFLHKKFALSNYFAGMFGVLPVALLPIIVLNNLGSQEAAYFFIPLQLTLLLDIIANSTARALFSEASQKEDLANLPLYIKNAAKHLFVLLLLASAGLALSGWSILSLYGGDYATNGFVPFLILLSSGFFVGINWLGDVWVNIRHKMKTYLIMNAVNAIAVVVFALLLSPQGLVGISFGWLIAQAFSAVIYVVLYRQWLYKVG